MIVIIKKLDIILIICLAIFGAAFNYLYHSTATQDVSAVIKLDGMQYREISLAKESIVEVLNADGSILNVIETKGGTVWMHDASCPDGLCIKQGKIEKSGQIIVCLPNRVTVEIFSSKPEEFDAIVK